MEQRCFFLCCCIMGHVLSAWSTTIKVVEHKRPRSHNGPVTLLLSQHAYNMTLYLELYLGEAWTHYPDVALCRIIKHTGVKKHTIHRRTCSHAYAHIPNMRPSPRGPHYVVWKNSQPAVPDLGHLYSSCMPGNGTQRTLISISRDPDWEMRIITGKPLNWPLAHKLIWIGRANFHAHAYRDARLWYSMNSHFHPRHMPDTQK